ncbi:acyl-CoA thioesterase [Microbacterium sp. GXF7504]
MTDEAGTPSSPARRLHVPVHLRWGDLDAFNHVNNTSMLKLLEEARVRAFWEPEGGEEGLPTAVVPRDGGTLTLVARQEIEYLLPVPYGREPLDVQLWFGRIGGSSIEVCYDVCSPRGAGEQVHYARSSATIVYVSAETMRPVRLTERMREAWEPYRGEPIRYTRR